MWTGACLMLNHYYKNWNADRTKGNHFINKTGLFFIVIQGMCVAKRMRVNLCFIAE